MQQTALVAAKEEADANKVVTETDGSSPAAKNGKSRQFFLSNLFRLTSLISYYLFFSIFFPPVTCSSPIRIATFYLCVPSILLQLSLIYYFTFSHSFLFLLPSLFSQMT